eukprot:Sro632_g178610.1 n/a (179) ;mRNA; r:9-666
MVPRTMTVSTHFASLALPLLWAALDESWEERMSLPFVLGSRWYERIKRFPVVPLSIWTHNTSSTSTKSRRWITARRRVVGTAGGTTGKTGQASTRQIANQSRQVTAMQTQQQVRTNEEIMTRIIAQHNQLQQLIAQEGRTRDSSDAALRGWLETWLGAELTKLKGNICSLQEWQHLIR